MNTLYSEEEYGALVVLVRNGVQQPEVLESNRRLHVQHTMEKLVAEMNGWGGGVVV